VTRLCALPVLAALASSGCIFCGPDLDDLPPLDTSQDDPTPTEVAGCEADGFYEMQAPEEYLAVPIDPPDLPWTVTTLRYAIAEDLPCDTRFAHALLLGVFIGEPPPPSDERWVALHPGGGSSDGVLPVEVEVPDWRAPTITDPDERLWVAFNSGPNVPGSIHTACPRTCVARETEALWYWIDGDVDSGGWLPAPENGVFAVSVEGF
jgi:hypothetical protein